ncbi:Tetratricopeptide repeat protein 39B [Halotydeus destructor]|nr:Tetratricopeptide repeat protein 39B [Halotydeus destructor]
MASKMSQNNNISAPGDIDMVESLKQVRYTTDLFFKNQFKESRAYLEKTADSNFIHSASLTAIKSCYAFFTMEADLMEEAMQSIAKTDKLLSTVRKPGSISGAISGWFRKTDYNHYTDAEALAEGLHGFMRCFYMLIVVISDQSMMSILKAARSSMELNSTLKNQFKESLAYMEPTADSNFMHSTGVTTIKTSYAFFTMEKDLMEEAMQSIAKTDKLLSAVRKPSSISGAISGLFRKTDYNQYTDAEALAEWLHVSMRLYSVLMTVLSDQSMLSVLKSARNSMELNSALKLCHEIMEKKTNWEHDIYKINFNFAILLNWGLRNLLLSYLPARVIKLMTFFGIPGINRLEAVAALKRAMSDDLKSAAIYKLGPFGVCFASYYFEQMLGVGDLDYKWLTALTDEGLREYPDGSLDLYFTAKTHQLRGHTDRAIELFNRSIEVQNDFPAIHNVCRWDLLWCYAVKSEWSPAENIDMVESLEQIKNATEFFFRNQFKESRAYLEPTADSNFIHSAGVTTIKFCYAFFTMEKDLIEDALQSIAKTDKLLSSVRKPSSISGAISGLFRKTDHNQYTDVSKSKKIFPPFTMCAGGTCCGAMR